ncbi:MAG: MmgE/PrpD family protein [Phycisphaerales bacterium]|jgi:2-methylcitrate dehydratase|nr:MmgE/PrpD family protein [Phycisphaerales bacterium]
MTIATETFVTLPKNSNQALGIGNFAVDFMNHTIGDPAKEVVDKTTLFFTDAVLCGLSALAVKTNAPVVLRDEALRYETEGGATVFGSSTTVKPEKAILANAAAVREWDSNGTNFGFNPELGHRAGEFGHNDFYAVPVAAAQIMGLDGSVAVRGMILLDEIRGRLAEVFSLKTYKIDHVVHGAIASAAVFGAMCGATAEQIESAIGMCVAHYIPWRAIRAGKQLSDSKGSSAAISTEVAILSIQRSMGGFRGPRDIFRNPESMFRQFEPTSGDSPFDLVLSHSGDDFAVMGMHFKIGLYEHQSAGALQGLLNLIQQNPSIAAEPEKITSIHITAYEPAFGIIGDPAKRDPKTRQSADHSMVYIVSAMLRKAQDVAKQEGEDFFKQSNDDVWKRLMLTPYDFDADAIFHPTARAIMETISFEHGGQEYDDNYPDGIPTSLKITLADGDVLESGLIMYPTGHARNTTANLSDILVAKFKMHGDIAMDDPSNVIDRCMNVCNLTSEEVGSLWSFELADRPVYRD